jgi:hypothetical protein
MFFLSLFCVSCLQMVHVLFVFVLCLVFPDGPCFVCLCLVYPTLSVSLVYPFLIVPSVFSKVYLCSIQFAIARLIVSILFTNNTNNVNKI